MTMRDTCLQCGLLISKGEQEAGHVITKKKKKIFSFCSLLCSYIFSCRKKRKILPIYFSCLCCRYDVSLDIFCIMSSSTSTPSQGNIHVNVLWRKNDFDALIVIFESKRGIHLESDNRKKKTKTNFGKLLKLLLSLFALYGNM